MSERVRCTCRDEAYDFFNTPPCNASYHHWQALLDMPPDAKIVWNEDYLSREDDVCHCKACRS